MYDDGSGTVSCGRNGAATVWIVLSSVTLALATVLVPLRVYVRVQVVRGGFWWDDVAIIVAWLILIPYFALLWRMTDKGLGRRVECVSYADVTEAIELKDVTEFLQILCTMFARLSIALFVGRLFNTTKRFRFFLYGYTAFMCASMIVTAVLTFTVCYPIKVAWDVQPGAKTSCTSTKGMNFRGYYNGAVGFTSDILLALLPAYFVMKLQMSKKLKISLSVLMAFGLVPAGCCLTRTIMFSSDSYDDYDEPLQSVARLVLFWGTEASTMVICAIIPTLRPMFVKKNRKMTLMGLKSRLSLHGSRKGGGGSANSTSTTATLVPREDQVQAIRDWASEACPRISGETSVSRSFRRDMSGWCSAETSSQTL